MTAIMPENLPPRTRGASVEETLTYQEASITNLAGRTSNLERAFTNLQGEVHQGFNGITERFHTLETALATRFDAAITGLASRLEKHEAQPKLDWHRAVSTVVSLAVLFGMVVSGIIYLASSIAGVPVAKQEGFNAATTRMVDRNESRIDKIEAGLHDIKEKIGWIARTDRASP